MPSILITVEKILNHYAEEIGDTILVEDKKITRIGHGIQSKYANIKKLRGVIIPGVVDAHLHLTWLGLYLHGADLRGVKDEKQLATLLSRTTGPIAYGRGWDQENMDNNYPTRKYLDILIPDRPAFASRICGHVAVVNTVALELTWPWEKYPDLVDKETGLVWEDAAGYVLKKLLSRTDLTTYLETALKALRNRGVTGVSSMSCLPGEASALKKLDEEDKLRVRVACYPDYNRLKEALEQSGGQGRYWRITGIKMYADGSLGARTARLRQPYEDNPSTRGMLILDSEKIQRIAREALNKGLRVATHAIGDEALYHVIEAYDSLGCSQECRVEHASLADDNSIEKLRALGITVVGQPRFRISDWWLDKRLGEERVHRLAYRYKTMINNGVKLALSTDSPVEPFDPIETIKAALGACPKTPACSIKVENLSDKEILQAYTLSAYQASTGETPRDDLLHATIWDLTLSSHYPFSNKINRLDIVGLAEAIGLSSK